ncbi:hypothetical protein Dimus_012159 [Dionaea muscipula]
MRNPSSFSFKFGFVVSLSFAAATSSSCSLYYSYSSASLPTLPCSLNTSTSPSPPPPPPPHKATAGDLIALLGPEDKASQIDPIEAHQLRSRFKFLVPFNGNSIDPEFDECEYSIKRRLTHSEGRRRRRRRRRGRREIEDEMIWCPPAPVFELARLAFDSGGDPDAIHRALDPTIIHVPDVEGSEENKCVLTRTPYGRHFINEELNSYLVFLFEIISSRGPTVGLNVSLNRFDLFHGHMFIAAESRRLGILFHAKEYPAYEKEVFPYNMGYCQIGSNVPYDDAMNLRNILWLAPLPSNSSKSWVAPGTLVVLDAHPEGIIYRDLIPDYVQFVRTLYEDDFGDVVVDVNYLNVGGVTPNYQLFIC